MLVWQPHCNYPLLALELSEKYRNHSGKKSEPSTIGEAISEFLKHSRIENKFDQTNLINQWEKVMGAPIAKRTTKIYIRNKKLFVHLSSAPLKHELNMSRDRILLLLTKELGKPIVNEVVIK